MSRVLLGFKKLMKMNVSLKTPAFPKQRGKDQDGPIRVGMGPYGFRRVFSAANGSFEFDAESGLEGYSGIIEPGPADYCLRDTDQPGQSRWLTVDVRGVLKITQPREYAVYMHYSGCVEFTDRIASDIYNSRNGLKREVSKFITQPRFEIGATDDGPPPPDALLKLNTMVTVAHAELQRLEINYEIFQVVNEGA